jgi:carbonic anhydrase
MSSDNPKTTPNNSLCLYGKSQSPIDIITKNAQTCEVRCDIKFFYRGSMCTLINTGSEFIIQYDVGSYVDFKNVVYKLEQISITRPASHLLNGQQYAAELLLYHKNSVTKDMLVVSVLLESSDAISSSRSFLDQFVDYIPPDSGQVKTLNLGTDWNAFNVLPNEKAFYTYNGSILKEPCEQNTAWVIFANPVNASTHFFAQLISKFPAVNNRNPNALNNRTVYYNPNRDPLFTMNYGSSEKCYNESQFRTQCSILSRNIAVDEQRSNDLLKLAVILFGVVIVILIMRMYDTGYATSIYNSVSTGVSNVANRVKESATGAMSRIYPTQPSGPVTR